MQIQPSTAKLTPKRKRLSEAAAPRVCAKTRKTLVRKVRKDAAPSSPDPPSPVTNQVWHLFPFRNRFLFTPLLMTLSFPVACRCRSLQRGGTPAPERFVFGGARGRGCTYQGPDHSPSSWCNRLGRPLCIGCCPSCFARSACHRLLSGRVLPRLSYCRFPCTRGTFNGADCHFIGCCFREADCCPIGCRFSPWRCNLCGLCRYRSFPGRDTIPGADRPFVGHRRLLLETGTSLVVATSAFFVMPVLLSSPSEPGSFGAPCV
jgi:hypothetical protein